jgi:putative FmdB family regulatory protein
MAIGSSSRRLAPRSFSYGLAVRLGVAGAPRPERQQQNRFGRALRGGILTSMPRYDFRCLACGIEFEAHVGFSETPACTGCGAADLERLFSPIAGPMKTGLRGSDARRSNATRRVREELRQEGFRHQREQRVQGQG